MNSPMLASGMSKSKFKIPYIDEAKASQRDTPTLGSGRVHLKYPDALSRGIFYGKNRIILIFDVKTKKIEYRRKIVIFNYHLNNILHDHVQ